MEVNAQTYFSNIAHQNRMLRASLEGMLHSQYKLRHKSLATMEKGRKGPRAFWERLQHTGMLVELATMDPLSSISSTPFGSTLPSHTAGLPDP
jgi:hypothetical protein